MNTKACCFAGHASLINEEELKPRLKNEIINLIENHGVTEFCSGGKGEFDWLCAKALKDLKKERSSIKSYLILSYMPGKKDVSDECTLKLFDGTIYPEIEKTPRRFAILKRNEWMVDNSHFLIAYVEHSWGGAAKTLGCAKKRKHIRIINLCEFK